MVSKKLILEFQKIVKEQYGKEISFSDANKIANGLVDHFDLLAKLNYKIEDEEG